MAVNRVHGILDDRCTLDGIAEVVELMKTILIALALAIFSSSAVRAANWEAGSTETFQWPGLEPQIAVRVPDNYTTDRKWPIAFHYHTLGMEPNATVPQTYSGNLNFITVAMSYSNPDPQIFQKERDFWEREFQILRDVREHLVKQQLLVDVDRTYVGGDGLGGWYASYFADLFGNELAGIYLTGAGTFGASKIQAATFRERGKPVYVGAAQLELNFGYALNAKEHFRRLGGRVTFDEFTGRDHLVPVDQVLISERLRQWFQIEGNRTTPEAGRKHVAEWHKVVEAKVQGMENPLDLYLLLDHLTTFPFYPALPADYRGKLEAVKNRLAGDSSFEDEMSARKMYEQLLVAETRDLSIENRRNLAHHYARMYQQYSETHFGKRAGVAVIRLRGQVEDPERFIWQTIKQREDFIKAIAENPLPEMPNEKLLAEMERVANLVYLN